MKMIEALKEEIKTFVNKMKEQINEKKMEKINKSLKERQEKQ